MELKIASWNIHKGRDYLGRRIDIQHSLDLIFKQGWDVCCLQEVPKKAFNHYIARTGLPCAYGATRGMRGDFVGNAILARTGSVEECGSLDISAHAIN